MGNETKEWNGTFDAGAYVRALAILAEDRKRVEKAIRKETVRRGRLVGIVVIVWTICSVALGLFNPELILAAEIGWVAIVAWAVFFMWPALMGRVNIEDIYVQYEQQLSQLEEAGIAMPEPSCMEDLVAAIDLVSPPETD